MAIELGTAYVNVVPSAKGIAANIANELLPVGQAATVEGARSGGLFSRAFAGNISNLKKFLPAAAFAGFGALALHAAEQVEKANSTIVRTTGATGKAAKGLEDSFKAVGKNVAAPLSQVATTVAQLAQRTGLAGAPLDDLSTKLIKFNEITGQSLGVQALTRVMAGFNVPAKEMGDQLDRLFKAGQATGEPINQLIGILNIAGPTLRQFGFDLGQSAAVLGSLDKAGVPARLTIVALRNALNLFTKEGRAPAQALQETIAQIQKLGAEGNAAAARKLGLQIFGARGSGLVDAALQGKLNLQQLSSTLSETGDGILTTAEKTSSLSDKFGILRNNASLALAELAGPALNTANNLLGAILPTITKISDLFGSLPAPIQESALALTAVAVGIGPAQGVIDHLVQGISTLAQGTLAVGTIISRTGTAVEKFGKGFSDAAAAASAATGPFGTLGGKVSSIFDGLRAGTTAAINAFKGVNTTVEATSATLEGAATVDAALGIANAEVAASADAAAASIAAADIAAAGGTVAMADLAVASGASAAALTGEAVAADAAAASTGAFAAVLAVVDVLASPWLLLAAAVIALGAAFVFAYLKIKPFHDAVNAVAGFVKTALLDTFNWVKDHWVDIAILILLPFIGIPIEIARHFSDILGVFTSFIAAIPGAFAQLGPILLKAIGVGFEVLKQTIEVLLAGAILSIIAVPFLIVTKLIPLGERFAVVAAEWMKNLVVGLVRSVPTVLAFFASLPFRIIAAIGQLDALLLNVGVTVMKGLAAGLVNGLAAIVSFFRSLPGRIRGGTGDAAHWLVDVGTAAIRGLISGITSAVPKVLDFFRKLPGEIVRLAGDIGKEMEKIGEEIIHGIIVGIEHGATGIFGTMKDIVTGTIDKVKSFLGIFSPSKVTASQIGEPFGQGIAKGIEASYPEVQRAAVESVKQAQDAAAAQAKKPRTDIVIAPTLDANDIVSNQAAGTVGVDFVPQAQAKGKAIGVATSRGIADGLTAGKSDSIAAGADVINAAIASASDALAKAGHPILSISDNEMLKFSDLVDPNLGRDAAAFDIGKTLGFSKKTSPVITPILSSIFSPQSADDLIKLGNLRAEIPRLSVAFQGLNTASRDSATFQGAMAAAMKIARSELGLDGAAAKTYAASLVDLVAQQQAATTTARSLHGASLDLGDANAQLSAALGKTHFNLNEQTQDGRDNARLMLQAADATNAFVQQQIAANVPVSQIADTLKHQADIFFVQATAAGLSTTAAAQYAATLLGIPADVTATIHSNADLEKVAVQGLSNTIAAVPAKKPVEVGFTAIVDGKPVKFNALGSAIFPPEVKPKVQPHADDILVDGKPVKFNAAGSAIFPSAAAAPKITPSIPAVKVGSAVVPVAAAGAAVSRAIELPPGRGPEVIPRAARIDITGGSVHPLPAAGSVIAGIIKRGLDAAPPNLTPTVSTISIGGVVTTITGAGAQIASTVQKGVDTHPVHVQPIVDQAHVTGGSPHILTDVGATIAKVVTKGLDANPISVEPTVDVTKSLDALDVPPIAAPLTLQPVIHPADLLAAAKTATATLQTTVKPVIPLKDLHFPPATLNQIKADLAAAVRDGLIRATDTPLVAKARIELIELSPLIESTFTQRVQRSMDAVQLSVVRVNNAIKQLNADQEKLVATQGKVATDQKAVAAARERNALAQQEFHAAQVKLVLDTAAHASAAQIKEDEFAVGVAKGRSTEATKALAVAEKQLDKDRRSQTGLQDKVNKDRQALIQARQDEAAATDSLRQMVQEHDALVAQLGTGFDKWLESLKLPPDLFDQIVQSAEGMAQSLQQTFSQLTNVATGGLRGLTSGLTLEHVQEWATAIKQMEDMGLAPQLIAQFIQAGPSSWREAQKLVAGGQPLVDQLNSVTGQIFAIENQTLQQAIANNPAIVLPPWAQNPDLWAALGIAPPAGAGGKTAKKGQAQGRAMPVNNYYVTGVMDPHTAQLIAEAQAWAASSQAESII